MLLDETEIATILKLSRLTLNTATHFNHSLLSLVEDALVIVHKHAGGCSEEFKDQVAEIERLKKLPAFQEAEV